MSSATVRAAITAAAKTGASISPREELSTWMKGGVTATNRLFDYPSLSFRVSTRIEELHDGG